MPSRFVWTGILVKMPKCGHKLFIISFSLLIVKFFKIGTIILYILRKFFSKTKRKERFYV